MTVTCSNTRQNPAYRLASTLTYLPIKNRAFARFFINYDNFKLDFYDVVQRSPARRSQITMQLLALALQMVLVQPLYQWLSCANQYTSHLSEIGNIGKG